MTQLPDNQRLIWPVNPDLQLQEGISSVSPIPFMWIIGEHGVGKSTLIATVDPVRPGEETRTLIHDLELSNTTLSSYLPVKIRDIRGLAKDKKPGKLYTAGDVFEAWLEEIEATPAGKYSVLGVDPVSDLHQGSFEYVGKHPELFGKTPQRYSGEIGIKSQWGDANLLWKQIAVDLAKRFQTVVFVSHTKDTYAQNVRTGKRSARGVNLNEIATLVLWLAKEPSKDPKRQGQDDFFASVMKSRLSFVSFPAGVTRPTIHNLLPAQLRLAPGQSYPDLIAGYMAQPLTDYGALNIIVTPEMEKYSAEEQAVMDTEKMTVRAELLKAEVEQARILRYDKAKKQLLDDMIQKGYVRSGVELRDAVTAIGPALELSDYDPERDVEIRVALEGYFADKAEAQERSMQADWGTGQDQTVVDTEKMMASLRGMVDPMIDPQQAQT